MTEYETVIGVETHVQLRTRTKLFCPCEVRFGAPPNSLVCPVCLGHPGVLPVLNGHAFELALRAALALRCEIASFTKFDRKNYYYPDLPKNYQISQYDLPFSHDGRVAFDGGTVGIIRAHIEEDAGKLIHDGPRSLVDLNRAGVPLVEIVTKPDLRSGDEAYAYLTELKSILRYAGVSDCDMEKGELRCDINLSVRPRGHRELGVKTEIKNLNSFRYAKMAIEVESKRQVRALEGGEPLRLETRLYDPERNATEVMRTKEEAHDYRYFPEPDLPPVRITKGMVERARAALPEMPAERRARLVRECGLSEYDARVLTGSRAMADFFDRAAKRLNPKTAANWLGNEVNKVLNEKKIELESSPLSPESLVQLVRLVETGAITATTAKELLPDLLMRGGSPEQIVAARGLAQVSDAGALEAAAANAIAANPKAVADFRGGKEATLKFLIGQVMREMKGRANPKGAEEALRKLLALSP
ncbi:MAG: Asp-tRNA(Asn)/Glu-tRNA(Gln) amidotransferase subunit GatB [Planctomycetes bacterium]|nr:Asp-tRNA(Asn)/Glu-tRNA(Gln) amidotransferase subunit GatB [Planctomycetota bacterium]